MSFLGFYFGEEGYNVYKDMHHSSFNTFLHGLFMPFVVYGVLFGLPVLWSRTASQAHNWAVVIYVIYTLYYFFFDFWGGLLTAVFYLPAVMTFPDWRNTAQRNFVVKLCFVSFVMALAIQEVIGHWMFEQKSSDVSVVLTSISIAPLFGVRGLFGIA